MILVTGTSGFVGGKIMQECKDVIACPSLKGLNEDDIKRIIENSGVDAVEPASSHSSPNCDIHLSNPFIPTI